ncbi:MAG: hypothetical protein ACW99Q_16920, partial [Candidatus Kariarchaeaceae archaeon]
DYAMQYLFDPLSVSIDHWPTDPQGIYRGGHDFFISPRDMARFGFLYLNNGYLDNKPIVPEGWVAESTISETGNGYGYLWWIGQYSANDGADIPVYFAHGLGGQYVTVVPSLDTIVVVTSIVPDFVPYSGQVQDMENIVKNVIQNINPEYTQVSSQIESSDSSRSSSRVDNTTNKANIPTMKLINTLIAITCIIVMNRRRVRIS